MLAQRIPLDPYISLHDICTGCFLTGYIYLRNWVKLGHFLWELNSRPSRSSGESFGADLPPQVIKGPKSARFYRVNVQQYRSTVFATYMFSVWWFRSFTLFFCAQPVLPQPQLSSCQEENDHLEWWAKYFPITQWKRIFFLIKQPCKISWVSTCLGSPEQRRHSWFLVGRTQPQPLWSGH